VFYISIRQICFSVLILFPSVLWCQSGYTADGCLLETRKIVSRQPFEMLIQRLEKSIAGNNMGLVAQASASRGAANRDVKIPGNIVLMVFRNDYAVSMLKASIPAGIEAPLRIYVTENEDGSSTISYIPPTTVFSPYKNRELDALAAEMDPIFERIVNDAVNTR
jgi:uncharacterized protein (DUF302 family)